MDDIAGDLGELIFSLVVSYFGALEFFFILRHWCHIAGKHPPCNESTDEDLKALKEKLQRQIADAKEMETKSGANAMHDGVLYTDGFRIDPNQAEIDRLKAELNGKDSKEKRRAEIEAELARQRKIEEETRKQLEEAEAKLARQQRVKAEEERIRQEQAEQEKRAKAASEEAENYRKLLEAEKQREAEQQAKEREKEKEELRLKREQEEKLLAAEKQREIEEKEIEKQKEKDKEEREKIAKASASEKFLESERAREEKQKLIENNARKFLEAEEEMIQLQQKMLEASQVSVVEEPMIVKRSHKRLDASTPQTVKTQFGQGSNESFTLSSKPLLFPSISDDASSNEPHSSKQSSFSTQPSDEITTGTEDLSKILVPQHERQDPDGEDNTPSVEYTEDYLRSLDGLKVHPLTREDGSGRRRAFKKRRSSGSSNSSRDSRASRDEELKMFTSLEEEEMKYTKKGDKNDFTPVRYTSEPNLKVRGHHNRRHKRSPAIDSKTNEDSSLRTSLEMLGEESSNPWGEVVPEHYKNTEFWRREKAMSIDEEEIELDFSTKSGEKQAKSSSFEDATDRQNEEAITTLHNHQSKELNDRDQEEVCDALANNDTNAVNDTNKNKDSNLQSSQETEVSSSAAPASTSDSASPRLRRSPRIDEMDQYEERWKETEKKPAKSTTKDGTQFKSPTTPKIEIDKTTDDVASWRDEHGLIMQGLSDFYDFTASVNPSRSRSTSRNPSPTSTPIRENAAFRFDGNGSSQASDVTGNTGNFRDKEIENITNFIKSSHDEHIALDPVESYVTDISQRLNTENLTGERTPSGSQENLIPEIIVEIEGNADNNEEIEFESNEMNELIQKLRRDRQQSISRSRSPLPSAKNVERSLESRKTRLNWQNDEVLENIGEKYSNENCLNPDTNPNINTRHSRSRSPLPTSENLEQSLETRRSRLIQQNDELFAKLAEDFDTNQESLKPQDNLNIDRRRSRSRSPLPTSENLERSLEARRSRRIHQNDELFDKLAEDFDTNRGTLKPQDNLNIDRRRSRSRSPLPTSENLERSLETRRSRLIQQNDELFDKLSEDFDTNLGTLKPQDNLNIDRRRSRSRSPLPTSENLERSLEARRSRLIQQNDELFDKLAEDFDTNRGTLKPQDNLNIDRRRSRSRSPLPTSENLERSLEARRSRRIHQNDELFDKLAEDFDTNPESLQPQDNLNIDRRRSRSRSPLPTSENLERSLEARRSRLIQQNDELFDKLAEDFDTNLGTLKPQDNLNIDRRRSRSRSPLPTSENLERSLEARRSRLIQQNDELFDKLAEDFDTNLGTLKPQDNLNIDRRRSRSRSPLPTSENLERSLEARRSRLIQQNDELFDKLAEDFDTNRESLQPQDTLNIDRRRSRSRSPLPRTEDLNRSLEARRNRRINQNDGLFDKLSEDFDTKQENLKPQDNLNIDRRHSRSRSPLPTSENIDRSLKPRRSRRIQQSDELFGKFSGNIDMNLGSAPKITIEHVEEHADNEYDDESSREDVASLVAALRVERSRSRSKSPMTILTTTNISESINHRREVLIKRNNQLEEHSRRSTCSPHNPRLIVEYVYEIEDVQANERNDRSRSPSRSESPSEIELDFHRMLNLESSNNRTLAKDTEEVESILAEKQRHLDEEALQKLKTANEETELRTLTPMVIRGYHNSDRDLEIEENDMVPDLPVKEYLAKQRRALPSSPDYNRTISEEWKDVQRIKSAMLSSGFKRSTYVGESLEMGSEYEQLRREAANFRRSRSPSPSLEGPVSENVVGKAKQTAAERRKIQDEILKELILSSTSEAGEQASKHGARPKVECQRMADEENHDTALKRSSDVQGSYKGSEQYEEMRRKMTEFQRSRSCSRSPTDERDNNDLIAIEIEAAKREYQDQLLDRLSIAAPGNFQDFSRHLNANFLDDRRSSDSAVIHKPAMTVKFREASLDCDMEPEEYHHYRRFSLNQEQQIEEYPTDDFVFISQIEVRSLDGVRTWVQEDFFSTGDNNFEQSQEIEVSEEIEAGLEIVHDDEETEDSEEERQTVVEVEDEIDTDICDYNERGPNDESHHEQSECEEAERAMDHYANRDATDWHSQNDLQYIRNNNEDDIDVLYVDPIQEDEEGAIGGIDSDSFEIEIDQIYDEAIKNRKQSGILREFDSILLEMQKNYESKPENIGISQERNDECSDKDHYALWAKTRNLERSGSGGGRKLSVTFAEAEKSDTEIRYLGDASMNSRQSTRLRSRYGYVPHTKSNSLDESEVDLNYKPKKEYNWRKNFKLDDDKNDNNDGQTNGDSSVNFDMDDRGLYEGSEISGEFEGYDDSRKFSLGGESITLYTRSPDRDLSMREEYDDFDEIRESRENAYENKQEELSNGNKENMQAKMEKPKKKKNKKKSHRESKESLENKLCDEDDSDGQIYSRRSSSRTLDGDTPKRKSRSRRESRSSITNDDSISLLSPRGSIVPGEQITEKVISVNGNEPTKKKVKKRKKTKDMFSVVENIKEEQEHQTEETNLRSFVEPCTKKIQEIISVSTTSMDSVRRIEDAQPQVTAEGNDRKSNKITMTPVTSTVPANTTTTTTTVTTITNERITETTASPSASISIESFDILKDANFYPLF